MENQIQILVVMLVYITLLIAWGMYQGRKVKTGTDYAIAGRKLPGWVAALSERATGESSWALLGLPGAAYAIGLTEIWTALGCVAGIITAWSVLAWRLRDEAEKYNVTTFTEYISRKHGDSIRALRLVSSFAIVFFFFFYVGAQFLGGGKTLHTLFGLEPWLGVLITAAIIVPYTIYGGFRSVVYTDVIQAIVMIITLVITPIFGIIYIMKEPGTFASGMGEALRSAGESYVSLTGTAKGFGSGLIIAGGFSWFFGYLGGQPQLSMRFMAISNSRQAKKGRNIGIAWTVIAYIGAMMIGWIGIAIFGPAGLSDPEYVMPSVLLKLFPPAIAAILITGAIAAMISTADSLLILSATELTESLSAKNGGMPANTPQTSLTNPPASTPASTRTKTSAKSQPPPPALNQEHPSGVLGRYRLTTAALAVVALILSYVSPSKLIFTLVSYVWAGIGCTFSVVILLSLFWDRYHGRAALATIIAGLLFTVGWITGGFEQSYMVTTAKTEFLITQNVIDNSEMASLQTIDGKKFASSGRFQKQINELLPSADTGKTATVISAYTRKGVPARLTTFFAALLTAVVATYALRRPPQIRG